MDITDIIEESCIQTQNTTVIFFIRDYYNTILGYNLATCYGCSVAVMIITRIRDRSANIILRIVGKITATGRSAKVVDLEG